MSSGNGWDKPEVIAARLTEISANVKALGKQIEDVSSWTRTHEQGEFAYHGRVEEHMALTREFMAGNRTAERAVETRLQLLEATDRLLREQIVATDREREGQIEAFEAAIQSKLEAIQNRIAWMMGGLGVVMLVVLPLAGWALISVHELDKRVTDHDARIKMAPHSAPSGAGRVIP